MESDRLSVPPRTGLEFDLQMVKVEQRYVEELMQEHLPFDCVERDKIKGEITRSMATLKPEGATVTGAEYLGGRILGYETEAVRQASRFLGRNVDFASESDRRAVGFAVAFRAHGHREQQYVDYMTTGKLP